MSKNIFLNAFLAAFFVAICGSPSLAVPSPPVTSPDEGKSSLLLPGPASPAGSAACDRSCLITFVDKYFDALLSRCTCGVALAPGVKYTENGYPVKPGEGIWKTFTGRGNYRVYLADTASGEAGYYGDFNEYQGTLLGVMALRLKVQDRRITEVELITAREQLRPASSGLGANTAGIMTPKMINELKPKGFVSPDPALLEPLPPADRSSRDQLIEASDQYFEGFTQKKGSIVPLAEQCSRRENGISATSNSDGPVVDPAQPAFHIFSQGCAEELDRGFYSSLSKFRNRRHLIVDEEQGLVLNLAFFDNPGNVHSVAVAGVGNVAVPVEFLRPMTYFATQLFKIENGKIREIEGISWAMPYGMRSGWD
jgi:hypothetical protein